MGKNSFSLSTILFLVNFGLNLAQGAPLGLNLILNGDAESGSGALNESLTVPVPNWITSGAFTAVSYSAGNGFPIGTDPGPVDRGLNFFSGGPNNLSSSASQIIDLSANASIIDLGSVSFDQSAFLGGFFTQRDNAIFTANFYGLNNVFLDTTSLGPVTSGDRSDLTGLLPQSVSGLVPVGTRSMEVMLQMSRLDGVYNDGYADNLSIVLNAPSPVPLPPAILLFGSGLAGLGLWRWRTSEGNS